MNHTSNGRRSMTAHQRNVGWRNYLPSQSPLCNAIVLIRKKDGSLRFCIDFHRLNEHTKKDVYPLPHMQEQMELMVGARHFSLRVVFGRLKWLRKVVNTPHSP